MYIISQMPSGVYFGEVIENEYYAENENYFSLQEELEEHDTDS